MGERNAIRKIEYTITAITISCALLLCALFLTACGDKKDCRGCGAFFAQWADGYRKAPRQCKWIAD